MHAESPSSSSIDASWDDNVSPADDTVPSGTAFDPVPGTGYRAVRRLGGGASAEVYEALAPDGARCAVKVLRALYHDAPDEIARLEQEAALLASLDHPSLAPVLDAGTTAEGRPFFVMPFLEGETVKRRLARLGPFAPREACLVVLDVCAALDAAHRAGVVHRDVKPGNVLLTDAPRGPRAVLLDFGIAKLVDGLDAEPRLADASSADGWPLRTTGARIVGTPRYLAPEQILGAPVDERADVYAAGLTLFEMIAGRPPFDGDDPVELMRAHLEDAPRTLGSLVAVSRTLDHAVAQALATSPARRWPSARAFAAVIARAPEVGGRRLAKGRPSTAHEVSGRA
jgi:serine/threonine-protein kinase